MSEVQGERPKVKDAGLPCFCLFLASCLLWLLPGLCQADQYGAEIKKAELTLKNGNYVLSAEMHYQLSESAKEALDNGVPLFWNLKIRLIERRDFLWNKILVEKKIRYRIQYHALLNMYRVRDEETGSVENFSTLSAALDLISMLQNFQIIDERSIDPQKNYFAEMKILFDREVLPLPLRPIAYLNSQWYLSSDWYVWSLTK
jgi:hypothetical protein